MESKKLNFNGFEGLIDSMKKAKKSFDDFRLAQFEITMSALLGEKYTEATRKKGIPKKFYLNETCDEKLIYILSEYAPCEKHISIPENGIIFSWVENDLWSNTNLLDLNLQH